MLYAIVNGEKTEAIPNTKGICPLCDRTVYSKCGEINIWHWAHYKDESCDSWYEPETEWHKNWKLVFGKDVSEIVIKKDGIKHIADVYTKENVVIELQNSPIQKQIIRKRELFYGERMIWLINGDAFKQNFVISSSSIYDDDIYLILNDLEQTDNLKKVFRFYWNWARKSWEDVMRFAFIDFGGKDLFWVKSGMGTNSGFGSYVSKEKFIFKYGGDQEQFHLLIKV